MRTLKAVCLLASIAIGCGAQPGGAPQGASIAANGSLEHRIVPADGYTWPERKRDYWPTQAWRSERPEMLSIDPERLAVADEIAAQDPYFRGLLVVKDGYLVFENYYHGGGPDLRTEVWSVTKSFTSALIGIAIDEGRLEGVDELVVDRLPDYPAFGSITIEDVLTHRTGLAWDEGSQERWIQSADWIGDALGRGFVDQPGESFLYSSANSHFLSALILRATGETPGTYGDKRLFAKLGIEFVQPDSKRRYTEWQQLHEPFEGTWRQDNVGLEIGAFGLRLTTREMAKFGFLYLNRGLWDGNVIIPETWVRRSTRDHVLRSENVGFGYHWMVVDRAGHLAFDADGWGGQSISVVPAFDMVVVTKCDAVNPQGQSSYRVLEAVLESVVE